MTESQESEHDQVFPWSDTGSMYLAEDTTPADQVLRFRHQFDQGYRKIAESLQDGVSVERKAPGQRDTKYISQTRTTYNIEESIPTETWDLDDFMEIKATNYWDKIELMADDCPGLAFRQSLMRIKGSFTHFCDLMIKHPAFEAFIIAVIIANTVALAMEDPTEDEQTPTLSLLEDVFLYIYTVECIIKVCALGFVMPKKAYLKSKWNCLDFAIVVTGWLAFLAYGTVSLAALRSLRILRPLRSISSIKGLKILFLTLVDATGLLVDTIAILFFFFLIFAIAGLQLWMGILRYRCMDIETGVVGERDYCGSLECSDEEECVKALSNPNHGFTNFDNILYALLAVFQCVTLEGWAQIMVMLQKAFSRYVVFYFVPLVFIGAYFLLNLTLAVIKNEFDNAKDNYLKQAVETDFSHDSEEEGENQNQITPDNSAIIQYQSDMFKAADQTQDDKDIIDADLIRTFRKSEPIKNIVTIATSPRRSIMMRGPAGLHSVRTSIGPSEIDCYGDPEHEHESVEETGPSFTTPKAVVNQQRMLGVPQDMSPVPSTTDLPAWQKNIKLSISTMDQGKEILQASPSYSCSEAEAEPDLSEPRRQGTDTMLQLHVRDSDRRRTSVAVVPNITTAASDLQLMAFTKVDSIYSPASQTSSQNSPQTSPKNVKFSDLIQQNSYDRRSGITSPINYLALHRKDTQAIADSGTANESQVVSILRRGLRSSRVIRDIIEEAQVAKDKIHEGFHFVISPNFQLEYTSQYDVCPYLSADSVQRQFQENKERIQYEKFWFIYRESQVEQKETNEDESRSSSSSDTDSMEYERENPVDKYNTFSLKYSEMQAYELVSFIASKKVEHTQKIDRYTNHIDGEWSGYDVAPDMDTFAKCQNLSQSHFNYWGIGAIGFFQKIQFPFYKIVVGSVFENFMTACVIANTIVLAMDHHGIDEEWETVNVDLNFAFTIIFIIEMAMKLIGLGVTGYCRDRMNFIDGAVVIISLVELIFLEGQSSSVSAFRTIRIFRTFRVLRVARLFRHLSMMSIIIKVITRSLADFTYLVLLLLLFLLIFALLGMQVFGGEFNFDTGLPRSNFDSFHAAFATVFQVLTMENWQLIMYDGMRSSVGPFSCLYFVSWIFLGNFVLLNLFLAILLEAFESYIKKKPQQLKEDEEGEEAQTPAELARQMGLKRGETRYKKEKEGSQKIHEIINKKVEDEVDYDEEGKDKFQELEVRFYKDIRCTKSYYIFHYTNWVRLSCYKISTHRLFEKAILSLIFFSSMKLVYDTYILELDDDAIEVQISSALDIFFTCAFTIETLIKSISMGLVMDQGSYLRESWNQLDMFIVVFSWIEFSVTSVDISVIKVLRLLRVLRPLRFISHNLNMKIVVNALLESVSAIFNVIIVVILVWLMFAILGVSLFSGKFYHCDEDRSFDRDEWDAAGFDWENKDSNFDNVPEAMLTLFIVSSLEGWPEIMYSAVDSTSVDNAPIKDYNPWVTYYFVFFILIGSFFFLNLFIAVVFMKFQESKDEKDDLKLFLDHSHQKWVEIWKLIVRSKPGVSTSQQERSQIRQVLLRISKSDAFEFFIMACIICNIVQMAIEYEGSSDEYTYILSMINLGFTLIFLTEAIIKLIGMGPNKYFLDDWNKFDFFVVVASLIDLILDWFSDDAITFLRVGPQLIRVVRVLRVTRLFRLVKQFEGIQTLLQTIMYSLPSVLNVLSLLLLIFFIYAILGVFIFWEVNNGKVVDDYTNFKNFGNAMVALLRWSTGEEWNVIMYDYMEFNQFASLYFISFIVITTFVMLNLFIMVILQQFEQFRSSKDSAHSQYHDLVKEFKVQWNNWAGLYDGLKMHQGYLEIFFKKLPPELALGVVGGTRFKIGEEIAMLDLHIDGGFVFFHDVLFKTFKRKFGDFKFKSNIRNKVHQNLIKEQEIKTKKKIKKFIFKTQKKFKSQAYTGNRDQFLAKHTNPFFHILTVKKILRNWSQWADKHHEDRIIGLASAENSIIELSSDYSGIPRTP